MHESELVLLQTNSTYTEQICLHVDPASSGLSSAGPGALPLEPCGNPKRRCARRARNPGDRLATGARCGRARPGTRGTRGPAGTGFRSGAAAARRWGLPPGGPDVGQPPSVGGSPGCPTPSVDGGCPRRPVVPVVAPVGQRQRGGNGNGKATARRGLPDVGQPQGCRRGTAEERASVRGRPSGPGPGRVATGARCPGAAGIPSRATARARTWARDMARAISMNVWMISHSCKLHYGRQVFGYLSLQVLASVDMSVTLWPKQLGI